MVVIDGIFAKDNEIDETVIMNNTLQTTKVEIIIECINILNRVIKQIHFVNSNTSDDDDT